MRRTLLILLCIMLAGCFDARVPEFPAHGDIPDDGSNWSSGLDAVFLYSYAFCIIIIAACIAVLVWMPIPSLKKWALMGITFCGCIIGMGITFSIMKPYIPWIVFGGCAIGALIGVWYIISHFKMLKEYAKTDNDADLSPSTKKLIEICQIQNDKTK